MIKCEEKRKHVRVFIGGMRYIAINESKNVVKCEGKRAKTIEDH
jgi:hypothetical protein